MYHKTYQEHLDGLRTSRKPNPDSAVEETLRYHEAQVAAYRANSSTYKKKVEALAKARAAKTAKKTLCGEMERASEGARV
jgi:hypothetical protein